ncbi:MULTISPECIES: pyruvate synthase subunit PorA [Pseudothermotoga]|jgi:pyruvate ferredoxin oxidoreductase alpha subunit|uniref:Pyruvate synthase subunit PorA n=2 Tax=Pseudothermotoga TaxID=1643951 RepID=A8F845_PSELT|nr:MULTISPECIES: pyruvate synthase subunit PorA [Pseudothermotoga]ABV34329.1 pyruvate flavodoxin/ferredoxin oxidoreductase domain protein [Pseudothermotoga lettingae TMO]KUK21204.1 MAG: Pyruvate flavodoxin/ferredoxin oxidoreductase domain protein [Pseudothermotoga lettingae]MDI3494923.1 pyruvate ferredoxin oxidoreductase alpha subunit [Pseudothermotoga sp.]MDK2885030.1 pyruvate ferredoxin oxidoreductase alpha subunit [Pseudothermotoga sp.]GLI48726.1 pyruvate synthase subunit PorA [Pseudothermo
MKLTRQAITGAQAAAYAMKQIEPDVVAAYPITPQTPIVEYFAKYVADGVVKTEMIPVESEHSAMSALVGAAAAGARAMTATSANGLALMHEIVYIAASLRLPIVMPVVNRALSGPINIHCDHSDTMAERDSGWIQLFCEDAQEVYDLTIMAVRIAEHENIRLPVMVNQDGFIISHGVEAVELLPDDVVKSFVGQLKPLYPLLDVENPVTYGPLDLYDYYFEHKRQQIEAMKNVFEVFSKISEEYYKISGRKYDYVEPYKMEDAQYVMVALGSTNGTIKYVVDQLREEGKKVGLLKIWMFRPFPKAEIQRYLTGRKAVVVLDRSASFGAEAPLYEAVKSSLYEVASKPLLGSFVYGLGGRDVNPELIRYAFEKAISHELVADQELYLGLRE